MPDKCQLKKTKHKLKMSLKMHRKFLDFSYKQQYGGMILHPSFFFF